MSHPTGFNMPPGFGAISSMLNLARGTIDASQQDKPIDRFMCFKSSVMDAAGEAVKYLKPCSKLSTFMPVLGKAVSVNDARMAWNNLQAEKSQPNPDPMKINQHQRSLFIASADTLSPVLPIGTMISTVVDVGTFVVRNPPVFTDMANSNPMAYHPLKYGWGE